MEIGNNWNGWIVEKFIGEGSFGKVYCIAREEFGHRYESALKVIHIPQNASEYETIKNEGMSDDSVTAYFKSMVEEIVEEFALMSRLKGNTNIVSYEDHAVVPMKDRFGWEIFIRMELLTPLYKYLKENKLSIRQVIQLGIDMCQALEVCQKYNIIHRDIKPENIFVSDLGKFKLGDFGIAKQLDKTLSGLSKKGTYTYMAPEVYKGMPYNSTVDIYSLGIVLYRFLNNNRTPFLPPYPQTIKYSDKERANVLRMSGKPIPNPCNASGRLAEIVLKACAYNPEDRYESAVDFKNALQSILYGESEANIIYPNGDILPNNESGTSKTEDVKETEKIRDNKGEGTLYLFQSEAEKAKKAAEEKARREAEERARKIAEEKIRKEAEERARREAEEKARREAEVRTRREAEERARREAEEKASREAEEQARREAAERARLEALERARREAEERLRREAEERARKEAEEKAKRKAEEKARIEAERKAKRDAEEKARRETEERAKREAEEKARRKAEERARREVEKKARREAELKEKRESKQKVRVELERKRAEEKVCKEADIKVNREKRKVEKTKQDNDKSKVKIIGIISSIVIALVVIIVVVISCNNSKIATIPDVVGMDKRNAISAIEKEGLVYILSYTTSEEVDENYVISQSKKNGTEVEKGTKIELVISEGKPIYAPNITGKTKNSAASLLADYGLNLKIKSEKYSSSVTKGKVISQDITAGEEVKSGDTISVVISKGEKLYKIPNVIGDSETNAKNKLKNAHLKVSVDKAYSSSVSEGRVIKQSQKSGKKVKKNTKISITISKGTKPISVSTSSSSDNGGYSSEGSGGNSGGSYNKNNNKSTSSKIDDSDDFDQW